MTINRTITRNPLFRLLTPLTLLAASLAAQSLTINTTSLPNGQVNQGYFTTFAASGGVTPYTWSFLSGSLPAGVSFSTSGSLAGTPTSSGIFNFSIRVTDAANNTANTNLAVTISSSSLQIATTSLPNGSLSQAYSQFISATGGNAPYAFSLDSGTLPPGLTLASNGNLNGTPTSAGSFPFTIRVTDNNLQSALRPLTVVITATTLSITTNAVPNATINQPYSLSFASTGGTTPYVYNLASGALPQGITLTSNGVLSGTPLQSGAYPITVRVTDATNLQATSNFTLNVITSGISFTTTSLPNGIVAQTYSATVAATGGTTPYTFSLINGSLPPGLTLAPSTGIISGQPTTAGSYPITLRVTDNTNAAVAAIFTITISSSAALSITTASIPSGLINQSYFAQLVATGGVAPITFSFVSGTVPIGISLTANGGITGTPTATGAFTFVVRATDNGGATADRTLQLFINSTSLSITNTSLPNGTVGQNYTSPLSATGGTTPYNFVISNGTLPNGLTLLSNGTISGVPTTVGTSTFTVRATDAANNNALATLTININNAPITITTTALPAAITGAFYNAGISASGGTPPYSFSVSNGTLPPGLSLSNNGVLTGVPTTAGSYNFTVTALDAAGGSINTPLTLNVNSAGISITTSSLPIAAVNTAYSSTLSVSGGNAPYTFSLLSGNLPSGLVLNTNGTLTGTPTATGSFTFTVRVTDNNNSSAQTTLALIVNSNLVSITTTSLPTAQFGVSYSTTLTASGGNTPYNFTLINGSLPSGLTLASNGTLSGTPTSTGSFALTIRVTDFNNSSSQSSFTLTVNSSNLSITTTALPTGALNQPYTTTISANGGSGGYSFTLVAGSLNTGNLPQGLSLASNGILSGTPVASGTFPITVRVTDSANNTVQAVFNLVISSSSLTISTSSLPTAQVNQAYTANVTASGGTMPYTFGIISGTLPTGITFSSNGSFSGSTAIAGSFPLTIRVTDSQFITFQSNLTLTVSATGSNGLSITTTALPNAQLNQPYSTAVNATGGLAPYTFAIISGGLPNGLSFSSNGSFSGTPTTTGSFPITVRVTDSQSVTSQVNLTLTVSTTGSGSLAITTTSLPNAQFNQPYSAIIAASGGSAPYTFLIIGGTLPSGLSLASNGSLSGTPTTPGSFSFTVRATDNSNNSVQANLGLTVTNTGSGGLAITTTTLPNGQLNTAYSASITAAGGSTPYSFLIISGTLPNGLSLSSNGTLSGTPTSTGSFSFTVRVTDANATSVQANLSLSVGTGTGNGGLAISTTSLSNAAISQPYSASLSSTGGTAPYTYSLNTGSLPPGINLFSNGTISGTATSNGNYQFTVRVTDAVFNTAVATLNLNVGNSNLTITTTNVPNGSVNQQFNTVINASGGLSPYAFVIISGTLPNGLSLSTQGILSGIPSVTGAFSFTVRVTDTALNTAQASFSFAVGSGPTITISNPNLANARLSLPYSQPLNASGGLAPYSYTTISGQLPPGIGLSASGILSGNPTQLGTFNFTVRITDANSNATNVNLTLTVTAAGPSFTTSTLPNGSLNAPYNFTLQTTPTTGILFNVSNGSLPPGLNLSSTGIISGIPTSPGTFNFTLRAADSSGSFTDAPFSITITQVTGPLAIASSAPPNGLLFYSYSFPIVASGGLPAYTFAVTSGSVPNGLRLDSTGTLSGTLLAPGLFRFTVRLTDQAGTIVDAVYTMEVTRARRLTPAQAGVFYNVLDSTPGARLPVTYSLSPNSLGTLPPGINLSSDGTLSGTPTTPGEYTFGVTTRDANNASFLSTLTLLVTASPSSFYVSTVYIPGATLNAPYSQTLSLVNGQAPFNWSLNSGVLPVGITLNPITGVLSGTPTATTTSFFTVRVTDRNGTAATAALTLSVAAAGSPVIASVTNAGSYATNAVAPGEILAIFGANMGPQTLQSFTLTNGFLPTAIAGTRVLFDGNPASLVYTQSGQVSAIAPFFLLPGSVVTVTVEFNNQQSAPFQIQVVPALPGLFTLNSSGTGPGAILNQNGSVNQQNNAAPKDSIIVLYATGGGQMTPPGIDGSVSSGASSLTQGTTVTVNGVPAEIIYAGNAPGLVQGVIQVNLRLPANTPSGPIPVVLRVGQNSSNPNVTVWVQ